LRHSVKYEEVYLRAYASAAEVRASISKYLDFYIRKRPHSRLDARSRLFRARVAGRGGMNSAAVGGVTFRQRQITGNRQRLRLSKAKICSDKPG
jgi:hypothetical protein